MPRLIIIAFLLLLTSCGGGRRGISGDAEPRDVIACVDARTMTTDDLKVIDPTGTLTADEIRIAIDDWIDQEVLLKIAETRGLDRDTEVRWRLEEARAKIILPRLGKLLAAGAGVRGETGARFLLAAEVEATKKSSRIERYPWKAQ